MDDTDIRDAHEASDGQTFDTLRKIQGLRVIIETDVEDQLDLLLRELKRLQVQVQTLSRQSEFLPGDADILLVDYSPTLTRRLPWQTGDASAALILLLPHNEAFSSAVLEAITPDAVLARPFTPNAIKASLVMGLSQFRYERRLRSKASKLEENLRAMRAIERAKAIVMSTRSVTGEEAYQYIRSQAMTRRLPVSNLAEAIVASYDLLGGLPRS